MRKRVDYFILLFCRVNKVYRYNDISGVINEEERWEKGIPMWFN